MKINDIKKKERRAVAMCIRTTKKISDWMNENEVSPTALFNEAVKELMERK